MAPAPNPKPPADAAEDDTTRLRSAMLSDPGRVRSENQDCCAAAPELGIYAVADGMGGAAAGEIASNLALESFLQHIGRSASSADARNRLREAIEFANLSVFERAEKYKALHGMGTTLVAALMEPSAGSSSGSATRTAWIAHVGDSRCYLLRDGQLRQLTTDHSLVEEHISAGLLTRKQAELSPIRNVITRAVGTQPSVSVDISEQPLEPGDTLLLASDGLTRELADPEIARIVAGHAGDLDRAVEALVQAANAHGGRDNITVILVACQQRTSP